VPAITIKNIPDDLYKELKLVAEQHHRSINSEVIVCLKDTLFPKKTSPKDRLANIQALRSQIKPNIITPQDIEHAINEGRP
jgi:plasmid stability protein